MKIIIIISKFDTIPYDLNFLFRNFDTIQNISNFEAIQHMKELEEEEKEKERQRDRETERQTGTLTNETTERRNERKKERKKVVLNLIIECWLKVNAEYAIVFKSHLVSS
jgi:hypothetical protein